LNPPDPARKIAALLKRIRGDAELIDPWQVGRPESADPLLWHLVFSFMAWEAGTLAAVEATCQLHLAVVDYNELRVCLPHEIAAILGGLYPRSRERAVRLRAALNDIYRREHHVSLAHLPTIGRRESRQYLESLEGVPPFVAARLSLLSLDSHAFPLDERLHAALLKERAIPDHLDVNGGTGWLERHFRAGEALEAYMTLETWMNTQACKADAKRKRPSRS
jgi:hypothetical protein